VLAGCRRRFRPPAVVLPSPLEVGVALVDLRWTLAADAGTTALTAWLGLTAGLVVGSILAFVMAVSPARRSGRSPVRGRAPYRTASSRSLRPVSLVRPRNTGKGSS